MSHDPARGWQNKNRMAAERVLLQLVAHQAVESVEAFAQIHRRHRQVEVM